MLFGNMDIGSFEIPLVMVMLVSFGYLAFDCSMVPFHTFGCWAFDCMEPFGCWAFDSGMMPLMLYSMVVRNSMGAAYCALILLVSMLMATLVPMLMAISLVDSLVDFVVV